MENRIYNLKIGGKIVKEIYVGEQLISKFSLLKYFEADNNELIDKIGQMPNEKITLPNTSVITQNNGSTTKYKFFNKWVDINENLIPNIVPSEDSSYYLKRYIVEAPNSKIRMEVSRLKPVVRNAFSLYTNTKLYLSFSTLSHISITSNSSMSGTGYEENCKVSFEVSSITPGQTKIYTIPVSIYSDALFTNKIGDLDLEFDVRYESLSGIGD